MAKDKQISTTKVEDILADHSPEVRTLVEQLRTIVHSAVPEAAESAHPVWHSIGYRHPRSGYFCGIFPHQDRVDLGLEFGVLLPDPAGLLEGQGKQVRYVRIRAGSEIREDALKALLRAALDLPQRRDVRLAMIRSAAKPVQDK